MTSLESFGRTLVIAGLIILAVGVVLIVAGRLMPGLGRLPGDIVVRREGLTIFFPLMTMIVISVIGSIILNIVVRFFNR